MINERKVRAKIAEVLNNELSIMEFARWVMSNSWNMHQDSSPDAVSLVSEIHLLLAERSDLVLTDAEFMRELLTLNNSVVVSTPIDVEINIYRPAYAAKSTRWLVPAIHPVSA